jgi:hypothetical protein
VSPGPEQDATEARRLDMALVLASQGITPSDENIDAALATPVPDEAVREQAEAELARLTARRDRLVADDRETHPGAANTPAPASPGGSGDSEPADHVSPSPRRNPGSGCPGALNIAGEHFACDQPSSPHGGLACTNVEAQAVWKGEGDEANPPVRVDRLWRTGISWGAAGGQMATLVEQGTGDPDEDGRRPDDRLVGALPADDAALVVDAVNARSAGIDTQRWALREDLDDADAATIKAWRERDDALAEVERLRVSAAVLAEVRSIFGGCRADDVAAIAAGLWAAAGESGRTARGDR